MPKHEGLTVPARVNFVAKGANLYELGYKYDGSAAVITNHLRGTWIWERVRVQGGAYGGFCVFDLRSGVWSYVSYRDPNLLNTLDVYDRTGGFVRNLELTDGELTKSIIGTIGAIDTYLLPDAKGYTSMVRYLVGDTDALRQLRRDQVLDTTAADFHVMAPILDRVRDAGRVVVVGPPEALRTASEQGGLSLHVTKVL